jgi:hypothetical protein
MAIAEPFRRRGTELGLQAVLADVRFEPHPSIDEERRRMFDYQTVKLLHSHGDGHYVPMAENPDHDSAAHDPERAWLSGARIFRCTTCDEEIIMTPAAEPHSEAPGETG